MLRPWTTDPALSAHQNSTRPNSGLCLEAYPNLVAKAQKYDAIRDNIISNPMRQHHGTIVSSSMLVFAPSSFYYVFLCPGKLYLSPR